jgi:CRISPR type III-A-associated protein Csm2
MDDNATKQLKSFIAGEFAGLNEWADACARDLLGGEKEKLSSTQFRNFFSELKRIERDKSFQDLNLISPKIKYAIARKRPKNKSNYGLFRLEDVISKGVETVMSQDSDDKHGAYRNFIKCIEAVLAFHKYHENFNSKTYSNE